MKTNRLEAFSDGVLAIIITIMVLEFEVPEGDSWRDLIPVLPKMITYAVSFMYLGIYWNNHHHLFQITQKVNGHILWANLHLLFWLSLMPFVTAWLNTNFEGVVPVMVYGVDLLMSAFAYFHLQILILKYHSDDFPLRQALGKNLKIKVSLFLYLFAIVSSLFQTWISLILYVVVAILWFIPNKDIEEILKDTQELE